MITEFQPVFLNETVDYIRHIKILAIAGNSQRDFHHPSGSVSNVQTPTDPVLLANPNAKPDRRNFYLMVNSMRYTK